MSSMFRGRRGKRKMGPSKKISGSTKQGRGPDDDEWGGFTNYMEAKKFKLGEQFHDENTKRKSGIFQGMAIYINGYTKPSSDELRVLITAHGGKNEMYLSKTRVTHIVASNLPNSKYHLVKSMPVVKPEWITESIAAGKCLPYTSFLTISNKAKLQAGLKSFPSISSISRSNSTSSLSRTNSTGSNDSPSNLLTLSSIKSAENCNKIERDVTNYKAETDFDENESEQRPISPQRPIVESGCDRILEERILGHPENKASDCINKEENNEPGALLDQDIVYNSEDEETPQRFRKSLSNLSRRPKSVDSPCHPGLSDFHIRNNNTSTPKGRPCVDSMSLSSTERKASLIVSAAISPIGEGKSTEKIDLNSLPIDVNGTSPLPSKSVYPCKATGVVSGAVSPIQVGKSTENNKINTIPTNNTCTSLAPSKSGLSPSKSSVAKAGDEGFINEYYSNSRLHHISTWGAEFKAYVANIQQKDCTSFAGRVQLRQSVVENASRLGMTETLESSRHGCVEKTVMHVDMDCFFVSVGLLSRPDFKGKPVAVTHSRGQGVKPDPKSDAALEKQLWELKKDKALKAGSGSTHEKPARNQYDFAIPEGSTGLKTFHSMAEIASCSYEARKRGVKNGMLMGKAKTLCPDLLTIPYDFDGYSRVSHILYDMVASFTHDIEAVSCDELFVDCTDVLSDTGATAQEFAKLLRREIFEKTGCTASVGIGPNILLARLATKKAKPNGIYQVFKQEAKDFIKDQAVSDLPGVGYSMSKKLARLGVSSCEELQSIPESVLRREFGPKTGESLHRFSLGIDDRDVKGNKQRKSVSAEVNYGIRFTQESEAFKFLKELSGEVAKRLEGLGVKGRSITLKLMVKRPDAPVESAKFMGHGICNTVTKSTILPLATSDGNQIGHEVVTMYKHQRVSAPDVRGIGIQVQRLEGAGGRIDFQSHNSLGGGSHQSILQFAVSRKPSTSSHPGVGDPTPRLNGIQVAGVGAGAGSKSDQSRDHDRILGNDGVTASKDLFRGKQDARSDFSAMRDVSFLLSPSQVSENVLDELPADIAQEIRHGMEQHRKGRHPAPHANKASTTMDEDTATTVSRPSTSSYCRHPTSHEGSSSSTVGDDLAARSRPSTSSYRGDEVVVDDVDELPTQSQLDMSCFQALPRSLQMELEEAYAKQKRTKTVEEKNGSPAKHSRDELPADKAQEKGNAIGHQETSHPAIVNELPSQSQLDMSCFHALPRSLQKELEEEYAKQRQAKKGEENRSSPIKGTALEKLKSPTKDKGKQRKKRRGRPPGSKKRILTGHVTKLKPLTTKTGHLGEGRNQRNVTGTRIMDGLSVVDGVICLDDDSNDDDGDARGAIEGQPQDNIEIAQPVSQTEVEFCGATSLKDVRNLFKEWIESCSEPGESDVAMVTEYLTSLVHYKNLEQTFCLLKFLVRYVQTSPRTAVWKQCVDTIAALVQSVVLELHGAEFKLFSSL